MSWPFSSSASTADELRSGSNSLRAVFQVFIDGSWKRPSECGRTVSSGGVNYIVGRPNLLYRVVLHNDHPRMSYTCDVCPDGQEHPVEMSYLVGPGSSCTVSSWRMDPAKAARREDEPAHAFKFGDIPEAPHGSAGAKSRAPGMSGAAAAESPGDLGKVIVKAWECERYATAPHTVTFAGGSPASSSVAPGVGVKKAQTKFGIHTAAPKPTGYAAPHTVTRDYDYRTLRVLPPLAFEYRDEVALCIAGILKSVPGAQLSGAKRSAAAAGLGADVKPHVKPSLAELKAQAAHAARKAAMGLPRDEDEEEDEDEREDDEEEDGGEEEGGSGGRGGRAAGGAARRGGAAASQSVAVVSLLHDEEAGAGKGGRRKRGKGGAAAAAAALPSFEETKIVRVVAAGGVSKGIREILVPVLPAGSGLGYSEAADGTLCLDDDDDAAAAAGAGVRARSDKTGKVAASAGAAGAGAGEVIPMPWYGLPHLLAAAQAALASEDSHSSRLRALDAAKALAEASLRGPAGAASSSSSSTGAKGAASAGGPAGRVWTHSGAAVTSIAQALSQGSGLPLVVAFGVAPAFKPMQDIHTAV